MAVHHYPPCRHRDKMLGISPHTDGFGLTLQIERDGRWFPVRPLPGAFVVNIGDILDVLTNGAYKSVQHRVVPDTERCRTTVVTFQDACVQGLVTPLPELLRVGDSETQPRYRSVEKLGFLEARFRAQGQGTRVLDSLREDAKAQVRISLGGPRLIFEADPIDGE
ncbi:hypothetical protein ACP4OV_012643 [Aristida adscensionis]